MSNYKQLYDYAKFVYQEDSNRYDLIDGKAARYLSVWTILLGAIPFIYKWTVQIFSQSDDFENLLGIFFFMAAIPFFALAWYFCFKVLRVRVVNAPPYDDDLIDKLFRHEKSTSTDIYYALAMMFKTTHEKNRAITNKKGDYLDLAYKSFIIALILLIPWLCLSVHKTLSNRASIVYNIESEMNLFNGDDDNQETSREEPRPDVYIPEPEEVIKGEKPTEKK